MLKPDTIYNFHVLEGLKKLPDESIDMVDLTLVQEHILGTEIITESKALLAADVDASGDVNSLDVALIKKYLLGLITEFPGENQTGGVR